MKRWWRDVRRKILPPFVYMFARVLGSTIKINVEGYEQYKEHDTGQLFVGWHGRTFVPAIFFRGKGVWTMISHSHDGDMQDGIFKRFGFNTVRGSTGRGGARAAVESIRVLKNGGTMAFTPDGPRGPSGVVQGGVMLIAKKSGAALVPVGISANRRWHVSTWDRYMFPKPFAKCLMVFGDPIYLSKDADQEEVETARLILEKAIHKIQAETDEKAGHKRMKKND